MRLRERLEIFRSAALQGCPAAVGRLEGLRYERPPLILQPALTVAAIVAVVTLVAGLSAQEKKPATAPNVTGTWNMGLQGGHVIPVALTLEQDGKKVKGVIVLPTQRAAERVEVPLTGELVDAALTLSGTVERAVEPTTIEIAGTLNDDGSMEGTITSPHGKMPWTAERLKERK